MLGFFLNLRSGLLLGVVFLGVGGLSLLTSSLVQAQTVAKCEPSYLTLTTRDHNNGLVKNMRWAVLNEMKDADNKSFFGSVISSSNTGEGGKSTVSFKVDSLSAGAFGQAIKVYDLNAGVAYFSFWGYHLACGETKEVEVKLGGIKTILRDADKVSLKNKIWELYTQKVNVEADPIVSENVAKNLTTGDVGYKVVYLPQGTYIIKVPAVGGSVYTQSNIVVNDQAQTVFDYSLSNVSVRVRDGNNNLLYNQPFTIFIQTIDADGQPALGKSVAAYNTGATGMIDLFLPTNKYAFKFQGTGGQAIMLWHQNIEETKSYTISFALSTLRVVARGLEGKLLNNINISIAKQETDANFNPISGSAVVSGNTGPDGKIEFYIPAGKYVVEITGPDGKKIFFYDNNLEDQHYLAMTKTLSALKVMVKDASGNLVKNINVGLLEQTKNANGELIAGKSLLAKNTKEVGAVEFYFPENTYALQVQSGAKLPFYFWDKEIKKDQTQTMTLTLSLIRIVARDEKGELVKNIRANLYNQEYDLSNNPILGESLATVDTGDEGFIDILLPSGMYAVTSGSETVFHVKVSPTSLTAINLKKNGELIKIESVIDPQVAVSRASGSLLRSGTTGKIYVLLNGVLYYISSPAIFNNHGYNWSKVITIADEEIAGYEQGGALGFTSAAIKEGSLVKLTGNPAVYLIENGKRRAFASGQAFENRGFSWSAIIIVSKLDLDKYPDGELIKYLASVTAIREGALVKSADKPAVFLIENGLRRTFISGQAFEARGYKWGDIIVVSAVDLTKYGVGENIVLISPDTAVTEGSVIKMASHPRVYVIVNGQKRAIASERIFLAKGYRWGAVLTVSQAKIDSYQEGSLVDFASDDTDKDGLSDSEEVLLGTDPNKDDTDGDSYLDGQEKYTGFNPKGSGLL